MSFLSKINGFDVLLGLIAVCATILAAKQLGSVFSGSDLKDLYGAIFVYAATSAPGRTPAPPATPATPPASAPVESAPPAA